MENINIPPITTPSSKKDVLTLNLENLDYLFIVMPYRLRPTSVSLAHMRMLLFDQLILAVAELEEICKKCRNEEPELLSDTVKFEPQRWLTRIPQWADSFLVDASTGLRMLTQEHNPDLRNFLSLLHMEPDKAYRVLQSNGVESVVGLAMWNGLVTYLLGQLTMTILQIQRLLAGDDPTNNLSYYKKCVETYQKNLMPIDDQKFESHRQHINPLPRLDVREKRYRAIREQAWQELQKCGFFDLPTDSDDAAYREALDDLMEEQGGHRASDVAVAQYLGEHRRRLTTNQIQSFMSYLHLVDLVDAELAAMQDKALPSTVTTEVDDAAEEEIDPDNILSPETDKRRVRDCVRRALVYIAGKRINYAYLYKVLLDHRCIRQSDQKRYKDFAALLLRWGIEPCDGDEKTANKRLRQSINNQFDRIVEDTVRDKYKDALPLYRAWDDSNPHKRRCEEIGHIFDEGGLPYPRTGASQH